MHIELYINDRIVDLRPGDNISIKKQFQDPSDLIRKLIAYSYTIKIPCTQRNNNIFGNKSTANVKDKFSQIYDGKLYCDGFLVLDGKLVVNKITTENYECNLYIPEKQSIKDILGDRSLREIVEHNKYLNGWDDITKINNYVGNIPIVGSELPPVDQRDNHICFPYVLYNYPYNQPDTGLDKYQQTLNYNASTFNLNNVFPAFNVLSVLKDVFRTENYNLTGNIFSDTRFAGLFQSYSSSFEEYKEAKNTPYYVSFDCDYVLRGWSNKLNRMNTSASAEVVEDTTFRYGVDAPLYSDNATVTNIVDEYEMIKSSYNSEYGNDLKTIIVPVSGWYQIHCNGNIELPDKQRCDIGEGNRVTVTGTESLDDNTSFARSAYEFHIMKGNVKENPLYWSFNWCLPCVPADYFESELSPSVLWNPGALHSGTAESVGIKILEGNDTRKFGKNNSTTLVKNLSGLNTDNFLCGARFGNQYLTKGNSCELEYREYPKLAMMSLPDVSKSIDILEGSDGNSASYITMTANTPLFAMHVELPNIDKTYGRKTAQILTREDSYSNFEGYNLLTVTRSGDTTTYGWDSTSDYNSRSFPGQVNSSASVDNSKDKGTFDIHTCVWLEEGDIIYPEILTAFNHQQDECSWYEAGCKCGSRKHFYKRGLTNIKSSFSFKMGIVSTDENWHPSTEEPIPTDNQMTEKKLTNVNKFLPNVKCSEYLNNFLQTFNLRLTQVDDNTYSIDYLGDSSLLMNTVDLDPWCCEDDATYSKITRPSTIKLQWKINKEEEGYVHGNDSTYNTESDMPYSQPEYEGDVTFTDKTNTSGSTSKKQSLWSYCWYKTIKTTGDNYTFPAPIISYAKQWDSGWTYEMAQAEKLKTDFTMRFFYIYNRKNANGVPLRNWLQIDGDKSFRLLIVDNYVYSYVVGDNGLEERKSMMLDYNNTRENTRDGKDTTITDAYFALKQDKSYNVELQVYIPLSVFNQMNENTTVIFQNNEYSLASIDGYSTRENSRCKVMLKSLF